MWQTYSISALATGRRSCADARGAGKVLRLSRCACAFCLWAWVPAFCGGYVDAVVCGIRAEPCVLWMWRAPVALIVLWAGTADVLVDAL
jgi:hypothetical protein